MKKAIALLLFAVMLVPCVCAFAESGTLFTPVLLKTFDFSAEEWVSEALNQALLGASGILDYGIQEGATYDLTGLYSGTVIVGRSGDIVAVGYNAPGKSQSVYVVYDTTTKQASYAIFDYDEAGLESSMKSACKDGCYTIPAENLKIVMDAISEAISENNS